MRYPKLLRVGDTIGVCAPSSGVTGEDGLQRLDNAKRNVEELGYKVIETASVRSSKKCVSADASVRAAEFMSLYEDPSIAAIIPPWGGEFLMDILPYLDFELLGALPPTWICGYSDTSLLCFELTLTCDISTIHGSAFMNMGYKSIHESDLRVFDALSTPEINQKSAPYWGRYSGWDIAKESYSLEHKSTWKALDGSDCHEFSGRMMGGCLDVLRTVIGTRFAEIDPFIKKYQNDGFIWTIESCEMSSADIYRMLWQMRTCGWFDFCNGVIFGRADGYKDVQDFTLRDALEKGLGGLGIPILFDADVGHIPPQMQIVNGAYGRLRFEKGTADLHQKMI